MYSAAINGPLRAKTLRLGFQRKDFDMAFLEPSDIVSIGYRVIDADHMRLMDLINRLYTVSQESSDQRAAEPVLIELIAYTKTHFMHEETLMRKTAYPQFIPHKIAHDRLMTQIDDFHKRYTAGQVGVSPETMLFLRTWLCDHVAQVDTHLGKWLAKVEPLAASSEMQK